MPLKSFKVLLVIDNLSTGGAQRQMVNLAVGLKRRNHLVDIFCYAPGDLLAEPLKKEDIPVYWHIKHNRYSIDTILDLRKLIHSGKYDLGLSFLTTPNFYLIISCLSLGHSMPMIVSERSCDLTTGIPRTEKFIRRFYRFADHIVVNSHHQRNNLGTLYPYLKNRLSTIYNGYDLDVFSPPNQEPANRPIRLLTIASVSPYKNGLCLVEALHILKEKYSFTPHVDWIGQRVMYGDRLSYLRDMERKIQEYRLEGQWKWLDQRNDIVDQFHQHDVLVHPSYGEGLPNVVCEAMACGRPVIISNVLDHARLVRDTQNGFLFDYKDPSNLAEKIIKFNNLTEPERREMGQCGRRFAEEDLSLDCFVENYEQLFARLIRT